MPTMRRKYSLRKKLPQLVTEFHLTVAVEAAYEAALYEFIEKMNSLGEVQLKLEKRQHEMEELHLAALPLDIDCWLPNDWRQLADWINSGNSKP